MTTSVKKKQKSAAVSYAYLRCIVQKKKKRARGTKTLLKIFYKHSANGDSQRKNKTEKKERDTVSVTFVLVFNSIGTAAAK